MGSRINLPLQVVFERVVARHPRRIAFTADGEEITFGEVNARANRLARHLAALGIGARDRVGVCMDSSPWLPCALLGIVKAGAAFVGLDPAQPAPRTAALLRESRCRAVVVDAQRRDLHGFAGQQIVPGVLAPTGGAQDADPPCRSGPGRLLQVVYTSGSSGTPKGVLLNERSLLAKLEWIQDWCPVGAGDVLLMYRSIGLAAGAWDCLMGPLTGVPTAVASRAHLGDAARLWDLLCARRVSAFFASPRLIQAVLEQAAPGRGRRPPLKLATSSGERLPEPVARRWAAAFPGVPLLDVYGASECASALVRDASQPVRGGGLPGARPARHARARVLDADLQPARAGQAGEIYLSGLHLAEGYLDAPALTAERFVPDPSARGARMYRTGDAGVSGMDGSIAVIGRSDDVVNVRGYRVGLPEVEHALLEHPAVREAAVVAAGEPVRLAACYVPASPVTGDALRAHLERRLPQQMLPSAFIELDALPRLPGGKIDRRALGAMADARGAGTPQGPIEQSVAEIWREVLERPAIGAGERFLDLGGDSVHAMRILARLNAVFGLSLGVGDLFGRATIRDQARLVRERRGG